MNRLSSRQGWTRRQALWLMAGAAGSVTLHACTQTSEKASTPTASSLTPVTIGSAPWIGCAPLYIAQEKGFFQEAGLDLNVKTFGTNLEGLPAFSAGQVQGTAPMTISEAGSLLDKKIDLRIIGVMDTSAGGDAILARKSITNIKDFKGKEIAVQLGGVGHFFLLQILQEAGLTEKDVKLIDTNVEAGTAAYEAGNVDIAYSYSPYLEKASATQKDGRIIYDSSKLPTAIIDLYIVSADFAQKRPEAVQAFLSSMFKALEFLNTQPQEGQAIAAKYLSISPEEVAAQLKGIRLPDLKTNLEMLNDPKSELYLLEPMTEMAKFLKAQNQIKAVPNIAKVVDPQYLQALAGKTGG